MATVTTSASTYLRYFDGKQRQLAVADIFNLTLDTFNAVSDFQVNTDKFTVDKTSGNTSIAGTLALADEVTFSAGDGINFSTGSALMADSSKVQLDAASGDTVNLTVDDSDVIVASAAGAAVTGTLSASGAATMSSTLGVTGAATMSSTLGVTGAATLSSTLAVTGASTMAAINASGDFNVNSGKFTVAASSGNTAVAGTFSATGAATLSSTLGVTGAATLSSTLAVTGTSTMAAINASGDLAINTDKFTVAASTGNTVIDGTLDVAGNATFAGTLDVTGDFNVNTNKFKVDASSGDVTIAGNLIFNGESIAIISEEVHIADNYLDLNYGYTTNSAVGGGLVVNYLPTSTQTSTDGAGVFVAGVASTSNPTVTTAGSGTFAAADLVQISGITGELQGNNGLYEVLSHSGNTLTIKGIGTSAATVAFVQNQFAAGTDASASVLITKVGVSVLRSGTDGAWEVASGNSTTGWAYEDLATASATSLQQAYDNGATITTASSTDLAFALASGDFTVSGAGSMTVTSAAGFSGGTTFGAGEVLVSGGNMQLSDAIALSFGDGDDLSIQHDATDSIITSATGDLLFDNTNATGTTAFIMGTDTSATAFKVQNNSESDIFSVTADGAGVMSGTFNATGAVTFGSTLAVTGATGIDGDFDINTDKFTVASASGNTAIAGTLGVTGAATLSSTLGVTGAATLSSTLGVTGATTLSSTLSIGGAATFTAGDAINFSTSGQGISADASGLLFDAPTGDSHTFAVNSSDVMDIAAAGATITGTLSASGDFAINTNKFTVAASSGNTLVAGTFTSTGAATMSSTLGVVGEITAGAGMSVGANQDIVFSDGSGKLDFETTTASQQILSVSADEYGVLGADGGRLNKIWVKDLDVSGAMNLNGTDSETFVINEDGDTDTDAALKLRSDTSDTNYDWEMLNEGGSATPSLTFAFGVAGSTSDLFGMESADGAYWKPLAIKDGVTIAAGDVVAFEAASGRAIQADASAESTAIVMGIAIKGGTGDAGGTVNARIAVLDGSLLSGLTLGGSPSAGDVIFLSETAAALTKTPPTSGVIQPMGKMLASGQLQLKVGEATILA